MAVGLDRVFVCFHLLFSKDFSPGSVMAVGFSSRSTALARRFFFFNSFSSFASTDFLSDSSLPVQRPPKKKREEIERFR